MPLKEIWAPVRCWSPFFGSSFDFWFSLTKNKETQQNVPLKKYFSDSIFDIFGYSNASFDIKKKLTSTIFSRKKKVGEEGCTGSPCRYQITIILSTLRPSYWCFDWFKTLSTLRPSCCCFDWFKTLWKLWSIQKKFRTASRATLVDQDSGNVYQVAPSANI